MTNVWDDRAQAYVSSDAHRRGEDLEQLVEWARGAGIRKLELHVFPWNEPAIQLYERFGFVREGFRKGHYRRGDKTVDAVLMALVVGRRPESSKHEKA